MNCTSWTGTGGRASVAPPLRRLGTAGLAAVLAASLYGCSSAASDGDTGSEAAAEASARQGGSGKGGPSPAAGGTDPEGPAIVAAPAEPGRPAVVRDTGTGEEKRSTTAPVSLQEAARPAEGLEITIAGTKPVDAVGIGPGGMAGPAIAVVVSVHNATDAPVSTLGSSVTMTYGPDALPASISLQPDDVPLPTEVAPGETASGTYTFLVPKDQRKDVVITASYRATDPAAVFTGSALDQGTA